MSDIRTSFYYDPIRQGYDNNSWRTVTGAPAVVAGRLTVDTGVGIAGATVHYADFLKGDISFNVNVPSAPAEGDARLFGVAALNTVAYIRFSVGADLTCQASDGVNTTVTSAIPWNSDWTGANVVFRIRWEAGTAKFFVDGAQVGVISDSSVPHGPMSLYLFDNSNSAMTVGDMNVRGTQSFVMNPKTSDTTSTDTGGTLSIFQNVTVTDVPSISLVNLSLPYVAGALFESVAISENLAFIINTDNSISDLATITEDIVLTIV